MLTKANDRKIIICSYFFLAHGRCQQSQSIDCRSEWFQFERQSYSSRSELSADIVRRGKPSPRHWLGLYNSTKESNPIIVRLTRKILFLNRKNTLFDPSFDLVVEETRPVTILIQRRCDRPGKWTTIPHEHRSTPCLSETEIIRRCRRIAMEVILAVVAVVPIDRIRVCAVATWTPVLVRMTRLTNVNVCLRRRWAMPIRTVVVAVIRTACVVPVWIRMVAKISIINEHRRWRWAIIMDVDLRCGMSLSVHIERRDFISKNRRSYCFSFSWLTVTSPLCLSLSHTHCVRTSPFVVLRFRSPYDAYATYPSGPSSMGPPRR